ncbi:sn-glycerol 3-phosphate transport system permease protein [Halohasta litchfieldiae]|jgi:sn-glycerol 3-phosphate transport system permease protein|uniref:sn-glycerol-3-phosphate transport system permease protein UgpA n=1 Tax=Halohasta litchfieldiae TaxID=1073996 RepID=A0A1H6UBX7_9EURY|nr:sugar ABC transporter permease [Halohasta litchfieldiae]ATW89101.1 sn-glycerol 3-phosphate transport system permease protein [Halohasta litchfieldiae]SEI87157.1 carbohydrate ABC transporter membrane protein 1, CUT1 family [Halohasta litchfieldiae]
MSTREIFDGRIESAVLLLPTVLVSLVFLYYPAVRAFRTSLFDSSFGRQEVFVGVENYVTLLTDSGYHTNVLLSILFAVCVVVGVMVFSLYITFLIHEVDHGQTLYLISAIWPYALPPAVGALVFLFMVHPTLGVLTGPVELLGFDVDWFNNGRQAFVVVALAAIWKQIGYNVIFMIASMNSIPDTLTETANIDGVSRLRRLVSVYAPIMSPTLFFLVIINTIYAFFGTFAFVDLLTGGGPSNATNILIFDLYREGFSYFNFGLASTKSVLLFLVVGILMYIQFRLTDEHSHYGA